jgi:hypothetical protein
MLVEAGIIPKNTLQQLTNWRLLPEDFAESHGVHPVRLDTNDPVEVTKFVKDLGAAITKDMAEIRETELDRSGHYCKATLEFTDSTLNSEDCDVFVDRLGRLVTPNAGPWTILETVKFDGETGIRGVVKREPRYEGDRVVALVIYLEAQQGESDA